MSHQGCFPLPFGLLEFESGINFQYPGGFWLAWRRSGAVRQEILQVAHRWR